MATPSSSQHILARLLGPLRFAASDGFHHLHTLRAFEGLVTATAEEAYRAGLAGRPTAELKKAARGFDTMSESSRANAVRAILGILDPLLSLPPELKALALSGMSTNPALTPDSRSPRAESRGPSAAPDFARAERSEPPTEQSEVAQPRPPRQKSLPLGKPPPKAKAPAKGSAGAPIEDAPPQRRQPGKQVVRGVLATPLKEVARVHSRLQTLLTKKSLLCAADILYLLPRTYEDRRQLATLAQWRPGERGSALVEVKRLEDQFRGKRMLKVIFGDATGTVAGLFFHSGAWQKARFPLGKRFLISGELRATPYGRDVTHPELEPADDWLGPGQVRPPTAQPSLHFERIVPIYPGFERGEQRTYRELAAKVVERFTPELEDPVPEVIRTTLALPKLGAALQELHFPTEASNLDRLCRWSSTSHRRLAFDELLFLQLGLAIRRQGVKVEPGIAFRVDEPLLAKVTACFPFKLTGAQQRVLHEIAEDMRKPEPMNRLLQGDVGSGKTAVALAAALTAIENGYQAVVMAPTEILAAQHLRSLSAMLASSGIEVSILQGSLSSKERKRVLPGLASGELKLVVGTHALLEEDVTFAKLGLVVIDEQHRFGVLQRGILREKGARPDVLVMTATPIPRTLAMAAYGDLDLSVIDEMPPGRTPIVTKVFDERHRDRAHALLEEQLEQGRQAYVVYPLVEESEKLDLVSATEGAESLQSVFPKHQVGLLHGRMKPAEKDAIMADFRANKIRVLVATTVVEVGVDVPNASVMLVEHAERFGLSQLHQLRGRVGRGAHASVCLLVASSDFGELARERLAVMEESANGFVIAERDLELRGPGEFLGTRQSGLPELAVANLARDQDLLALAQREAQAIALADPRLEKSEHHALKEALEQRWAGKLALAKIG